MSRFFNGSFHQLSEWWPHAWLMALTNDWKNPMPLQMSPMNATRPIFPRAFMTPLTVVWIVSWTA